MFAKKYFLAALLAAAPLATYAAETVYIFDRITRIEHHQSDVLLSGILVNDATPTTVTLPANFLGRCENLFNVVLSQPAAYTVMVATELVPSYPSDYLIVSRCSAEPK